MKLTPDDDRISAYLDGELSPEERAAFEAELATSPEVRRLVDELGGLKQRVNELPAVGVKVNLAPEILRRIETHRPGSHLAATPSSESARPTGPAKLRFEAVSTGASSKQSWYSRSHRAIAMMVGSLAVVVIAVGTTLWWQVEKERAVGDALDFGVALKTEVPAALDQPMEISAAPNTDFRMTRSDLAKQLEVNPAELLAQVPQLNAQKKWATMTPAPEGPVVESQMLSEQVVNNFYIQNTNPTGELIPVEVYCTSVPATARALEDMLASNGIAVQNRFTDQRLAAAQSPESSVTTSQNLPEVSKDSDGDGVSTMTMMRSTTVEPSPAMTSSMMFNQKAQPQADNSTDGSMTQYENGDVAVYVEAPASQVLRFLADAEQQQDVSKLMFNTIEPVQVLDSDPMATLSAATESVTMESNIADSQPVDVPAAPPKNARMMKSNVLPQQAFEAESTTTSGQSEQPAAESFSTMAGTAGAAPVVEMMDRSAGSVQSSAGQATWMDLPRQPSVNRDYEQRGYERRQIQAPLQNSLAILPYGDVETYGVPPEGVQPFARNNRTRGYSSTNAESRQELKSEPSRGSSDRDETTLGSTTPGGLGGFHSTVLSEPEASVYSLADTPEPRWRVLLILRAQTPPAISVPPPPAMPEPAD